MIAIYLTEFIGTFFLVLTIGLTVTRSAHFTPLAVGGALMVMVYMGGHVSGAHYNPAVTLAVWRRGKLAGARVLPYIVAQIAGALTAAAVVAIVTGATFGPARGAGVGVGEALLLEALFTFALALVVLNAATAPRTDGNSFYGLAIGFTVFAGAVAAGAISGGAFNPAVAIGSLVVQAALARGGSSAAVATWVGAIGDLWIYIVGPCAGAAAAATVYRLQNPESPRAAESVASAAGDFAVPVAGGEPARRAAARSPR
jgi:aquaporin Z